ncbi:MAG: hypothetical protein DMG07_00190 [Acidobacteria bacterium]|nr:MAG: hypothetical protein DMG07_00190 [Acidobacteriota bacterium]
MDARFRKLFNAAFTGECYDRYRRALSERLNTPFYFRLAESPVFLPEDLRGRFVSTACEILDQLSDPSRLALMKRAVPPEWDTPRMDALPSFAQIDLAVARDAEGRLAPRLIELQGFPSLTAMQVIQRDVWAETLAALPGLDREWTCWFSGLDREAFLDLARRTILGDHDPRHVILMDLDPPSQKTFPDFAATRLLFGVEAVCPTQLIKRGRTLWRRAGGGPGGLVPVRRIYNRVVFDELARKRVELPFDYREDLDVEWTPHPNWFWVWSKYSLPFLDHPAVPRATLLSDLDELPEDLARRYVLKPLFSFAGGGVRIEPTPEDVARIPGGERSSWCLQEKIEYAPALEAADGGGVKVEIRMMFLRPDAAPRPVLAQNLCRLSRGAMLGVDFNKAFTWVGSSVGIWPA